MPTIAPGGGVTALIALEPSLRTYLPTTILPSLLTNQPILEETQHPASTLWLQVNPIFFSECTIQPSLHSTCHHQINQCKFLIDIPPPNPYNRRVWHYNRADTASIHRSIVDFDWNTNLNACSHDVDAQANLLTNTLLNI